MRKMLIPGGMALFLAVVLLLSCATLAVKPITQADLPDLKGKWKGFYQYRGGSYTTSTLAVELEILDEKLNGNWTWNRADRPPADFPSNGKIENGRIMYSWPGGQADLGLRKGEGEMKLEGDYQFESHEGTMYLNKVK